jgi:hypothetical protein
MRLLFSLPHVNESYIQSLALPSSTPYRALLLQELLESGPATKVVRGPKSIARIAVGASFMDDPNWRIKVIEQMV